MSDLWVEATGLSKHFKDFVAVGGIDLAVKKGEVLGFLGPNGAGKTTTMRMLTGYLEPTAGSVSIHGIDIERDPLRAKEMIGYLPEGAPLYADMTPRQLLRFVAQARRMEKRLAAQRIEAVIAQLELETVLDQAIDTLSKGFKRRVGLAQAILHEPPVLILDEPTDGLDPLQKQQVRRLIREMAADKAIIISTHILEEVEAVCSRAIIIAHGRIVADGTPQALLAQSVRHHRVRLVLSGADTGAKAALAAMPSVAAVEAVLITEGEQIFSLSPQGEAVDLAQLGSLSRQHGWIIVALEVEQGDLDEVFIRLATEARGAAA